MEYRRRDLCNQMKRFAGALLLAGISALRRIFLPSTFDPDKDPANFFSTNPNLALQHGQTISIFILLCFVEAPNVTHDQMIKGHKA